MLIVTQEHDVDMVRLHTPLCSLFLERENSLVIPDRWQKALKNVDAAACQLSQPASYRVDSAPCLNTLFLLFRWAYKLFWSVVQLEHNEALPMFKRRTVTHDQGFHVDQFR